MREVGLLSVGLPTVALEGVSWVGEQGGGGGQHEGGHWLWDDGGYILWDDGLAIAL